MKFALVLLFMTGLAVSEEQTSCAPVEIAGPSILRFSASERRPTIDLSIGLDDAQKSDSFAEDHFILRLKAGTDPEVKLPFSSTYGMFSVYYTDVTGDGIEDLVLITGQGRGTNARSERLDVFRVEKQGVKRVLSTPYSGPIGPSGTWSYSLEMKSHGDWQIHLKKTVEVNDPNNDDISLAPKANDQYFLWSSQRGHYETVSAPR